MIRQQASKYVVLSILLLSLTPIVGQDSVERYAEEGQAALAAGRYADAEKAFEKLQQLEPRMAEVHANLGLIYFEQRKFE